MKIIEYFTSEHQSHWLEEMRRCDWEAGQYLARLLQRGQLKSLVGRTALVPMLIEEETDTLVSFCTFAPLDDIQPTELSPWVGFVYTFPQYRGHRYAGQLLRYAESLATVMGKEFLYISTGHTGLYETYGYEFYQIRKDIGGEDSRVYRKALQVDGSEKERRMELGGRWKGEIVAAASKAQALFIRKFGRPAFFQVHDRLHQQYTFEKTQEILGESMEGGLRILEECWKSMQESNNKTSL